MENILKTTFTPNKSKITATKIGILLFCLFTHLFFRPALLFILPGSIFFLYKDINTDFSKTFAYSIAVSVAYWTSGFWLLKYIPVSYSIFILFSILVSIILIIIKRSIKVVLPAPSNTDIASFIFMTLILITLIPICLRYKTPAGADMATHTYIARLIYEKNTFPISYEPIAPADKFGSSPIGLSILIAGVSLVDSEIPIHQSGLMLSVFSYLIFGLSLFIFVKRYFGLLVSFLTVISVVWLGPDLLQYALWGGIPTILAIAQLLFLVSYLIDVFKQQKFTFINAFFCAILAFGSFSTHHIPAVVFVYICALFIFFSAKSLRKNTKIKHIKFLFTAGFIILPFFLSFISSFKPPSQDILNYIKDWQRDFQIHSWKGTVNDSLYTIPFFIANRIGASVFVMAFFGILLSLGKIYSERKELKLSLYLLGILFVFILNSQYWFLPLSPILYPDRVITLGLIPISLFIAIFYEYLVNIFRIPVNRRVLSTNIILAFLLLSFGIFLFSDNYKWFYDKLDTQVSVTNDDIKLFEWMETNTLPTEVIQNNYGDAGVWIPTFIYRKVTNYDGMIYDIEEIRRGAQQLKPGYLFIGSKPVYTDAITYTFEDIIKNSKYEAVYRSGDSWLFKINQ